MKKLFGALVKLFSLLAVLGALLYAAVRARRWCP